MSKLTKQQAKLHAEACSLLALDRDLSYDERVFVLDNWNESARHINSVLGAYFTPRGLARDLSIYTPDYGSLIDICAGIGTLAFHSIDHSSSVEPRHIVCVELNPDYVNVGRKLVPEATWIVGDIFDPATLAAIPLPPNTPDGETAPFDCCICNPPFGRSKPTPLSGVSLDLNMLAFAARYLASFGVFILPQMSCPFEYSGSRNYRLRESNTYEQFFSATGIELTCSSVDCSLYRDDWQGVSPVVEIAIYDLDEQKMNPTRESAPSVQRSPDFNYGLPRTNKKTDISSTLNTSRFANLFQKKG